jgi:hypothetical protein
MCYILMIYNAILILLFGGGENREACIDVVWWKVRGVEYLFISLHIFFFFFFFYKFTIEYMEFTCGFKDSMVDLDISCREMDKRSLVQENETKHFS